MIFDTTQPKGPPPSVTSSTPYAGSSSNLVSVDPSVTFSEAVVPSTASFTLKDASGNTVPGSASFNSADTVDTFTPSSALAAGTTHTATISGATDQFSQTMSVYTYTFTTSKAFDAAGQCPCAIWPDVAPSAVTDAADTSSVELGVEFQATANGTISGIRFYKGSSNTGTHVGSLWTASGTLLGQVTFTNESATGWQQASFSSPIAVTAGTTYVASYLAPNGGYADDSGYFANSGVINPPLEAPQSSAVSGGNGRYSYGSSPGLPSSTYNASNYWVDVVFTATAP